MTGLRPFNWRRSVAGHRVGYFSLHVPGVGLIIRGLSLNYDPRFYRWWVEFPKREFALLHNGQRRCVPLAHFETPTKSVEFQIWAVAEVRKLMEQAERSQAA